MYPILFLSCRLSVAVVTVPLFISFIASIIGIKRFKCVHIPIIMAQNKGPKWPKKGINRKYY